jgi:glyoxylate carboligase
VLDKGFAIGTNEPFHVFKSFIPENRLLCVDLNQAFPPIPKSIDMVFDLAGSISNTSKSITTAIEQSDVVLIPIYNEVKSIHAGLNTIAEVLNLNKNIIVIATKLKKKGRADKFKDWKDSNDCKNISNLVQEKFGDNIPVLPLKYSEVFDTIFEQEKSIAQLMKKNGLNRYLYK